MDMYEEESEVAVEVEPNNIVVADVIAVVIVPVLIVSP